MINVVDVTHHYGVKPVLRHVNLRVAPGEVVALMGPNGMGKSTLMAAMAGVLSPLKGYVEIDGRRRRATPEDELAIRRRVVYLPPSPWLPQSLTPREWLLGVGRLYEIEDDRLMDHVGRLLELFNLGGQADEGIGSLSTGQQKKVAICGTLVTEAPVMLLDEPFAGGLDPSGLLALKRVLQRHARGDRFTVVMATPVPELVEEVADKVAIIRDGQIIAFDTIDGLRRSTGVGGKLDAVYEQLVSPDTAGKIDRYFAAEGGR
ncbi:MAG TPA: ABC transporter ATP-binding protein [Tepidisphaeraceae bacterium]|nr:ABC transporter ATP-binding protein [Tepidisphaeraceae bacterium]